MIARTHLHSPAFFPWALVHFLKTLTRSSPPLFLLPFFHQTRFRMFSYCQIAAPQNATPQNPAANAVGWSRDWSTLRPPSRPRGPRPALKSAIGPPPPVKLSKLEFSSGFRFRLKLLVTTEVKGLFEEPLLWGKSSKCLLPIVLTTNIIFFQS